MKIYITILSVFVLLGCQQKAEEMADAAATNSAVESTPEEVVKPVVDNSAKLAASLAAQPEDVRARYSARNPQATLEFFGIEPGMTVVEGLPGGGWYTKVLLPYLGEDGCVIGVNYELDMWPLFSFATEEFIAKTKTWVTDWVVEAEGWRSDDSASLKAFHFGSLPDDVAGTADVVFFARVLHNLARFESDGDYLTTALKDSYSVLKPGGIFGVVQHEARENMPDSFADGSHGYLKKAFVIAAAEQAGFEFVGEIGVNANPADQPSAEDIVWRLAPTFATSRDDEELKSTYAAVGESNRMTLKFRKPE